MKKILLMFVCLAGAVAASAGKSYIFLAPGFEEVEALTTVDALRRAHMDVVTVAVADGREVTGAPGRTRRRHRSHLRRTGHSACTARHPRRQMRHLLSRP